MTFRFIEQHRDCWPVAVMCQTLEASSAGYYAWRDRPASGRRQRQDALTVQIRAVHAQMKARYGSPRIRDDRLSVLLWKRMDTARRPLDGADSTWQPRCKSRRIRRHPERQRAIRPCFQLFLCFCFGTAWIATGCSALATDPPKPQKPADPEAKRRFKRILRWELVFDIKDAKDYLSQLGDLGAFIATPDTKAKVMLIRDLNQRPAKPNYEDVKQLKRFFMIDDC